MKKKQLPLITAVILIAAYLLFSNLFQSPAPDPVAPSQTQVQVDVTDPAQSEDPAAAEAEDPGNSDAEDPGKSETDDPGSADAEDPGKSETDDPGNKSAAIDENGTYTSKDDVALYIHTYGHLPSNYLTKKEAQALGWKDSGTLDKVAPGMSIGGDRFGNREGQLPKGHTYYECDIDYKKGGRNGKRIVFSEDGLIYYTEDHYNTFTLLYGEE